MKHMGLPICVKMHAVGNDIEVVAHMFACAHAHTDAEGAGCWYEGWWVVSWDGSSMSVQCVLRVFKWVKSQLWLPDGGEFDPDHSDRPGLWCAAAYYWHYLETGIFLLNHFQFLHASPVHGLHQPDTPGLQRGSAPLRVCINYCVRALVSVYLLCNKNGSVFTAGKSADIHLSHIKQAVKFSLLMYIFITGSAAAQHGRVFTQVVFQPNFWLSSWSFLVNL